MSCLLCDVPIASGVSRNSWLLQQIPIDVEPPSALPDETAALMEPDCGSIAYTRARDELNFAGVVTGDTRIHNAQTQPLLIPCEGD
jgi:hypothetical protein